jgi:hypothetical protein
MKLTLKYILSIAIVFSSLQHVFAQKNKFLPSQFKVGTDVSYLGLSVLSKEKSQFEINSDIDFHRFFIAVDYGYATWKMTETDYEYQNSGTYYRFGLDYNFITPGKDHNAIYIGLKYAGTQFSENFNYEVQDLFYGDYSNDIRDIKRTGRWFEIVVGMKIRIWKGLFLGWTGRFKFAPSISSSQSTFSNFWIPGYGKPTKDSRWGLNYQIFYSLPLFRKNYQSVNPQNEAER